MWWVGWWDEIGGFVTRKERVQSEAHGARWGVRPVTLRLLRELCHVIHERVGILRAHINSLVQAFRCKPRVGACAV